MMYKTVCGFELLLDNTCWIVYPLPLVAPVIAAGSFTTQLIAVPGMVDDKVILVCVEGQIVSGAGAADITGSGFIVTL